MAETVDTVKIKHPDGYAIINKEDFNPKEHELYSDKAKGKAKEGDDDTIDISKLKVAELKEFAAANGIDLGAADTKAEILAVIEAKAGEAGV